MVKLSRTDKTFSPIKAVKLAAVGILERHHLQEFIFNSFDHFCEEIGQKMKIIAKEQILSDAVNNRIDLLAVDQDGNTIVIELKRDSNRLELLQAIAYAGMVAQRLPDELLGWAGERRESIENFVEDPTTINGSQRIILVAEAYDYEVLIAAEWLYEKYEVDLLCVRVEFAEDEATKAEYLSFTRVFPPQEVDEIARRRGRLGRGRQGRIVEAAASWQEALSSVTNDAVKDFFNRHLTAGRENSLKYRSGRFYLGGKRKFSVAPSGQNARVKQRDRFSQDVEFWQSRISLPDSVKTGTSLRAGDILRFRLSAPADFAAFEKAVSSDLQTVKWGHAELRDEEQSDADNAQAVAGN